MVRVRHAEGCVAGAARATAWVSTGLPEVLMALAVLADVVIAAVVAAASAAVAALVAASAVAAVSAAEETDAFGLF